MSRRSSIVTRSARNTANADASESPSPRSRTLSGGVANRSSSTSSAARHLRSSLRIAPGSMAERTLSENSQLQQQRLQQALPTSSVSPTINAADEDMEITDDEEDGPTPAQPQKSTTNLLPVRHLFREDVPGIFTCLVQVQGKPCERSIRASTGSDANLRQHLGSQRHNMPNVKYKSQTKGYQPAKRSMDPDRRRELQNASVECIVTDGRAFDDLNKPGIIRLFNLLLPGFKAPHRCTVRRSLRSLYLQHRAEMRDSLAAVSHIALTSDVWTSTNGMSFICLTGHMFNPRFEMVSLVLGFRRLQGAHLAKTLRKYILYELNKLKIKEKICAITTDSGSDIKCATKDPDDFKQRYACLAHTLNLVVSHALALWKIPKNTVLISSTTTGSRNLEDDGISIADAFVEDECDEAIEAEEESDDKSEDHTDDDGNTTLSDDSTHTSSDEDEFSSDDEEEIVTTYHDVEPLLSLINNLLRRSRRLVKMIRRNRCIREHVQSLAKDQGLLKLVLDVKIRWNSTYLMVERFLTYQAVINSITNNPHSIPRIRKEQMTKLKTCAIANGEWDTLSNLKSVLHPFLVATMAISSSNYPSMATGYLIIKCLRRIITTDQAGDSEELKLLKLCLLNQFNQYFDDVMEDEEKETGLVAAFIDPGSYHRLNKQERELAVRLLTEQMEKETIANMVNRLQQVATTSITNNANSQATASSISATDQNSVSSSGSRRTSALNTLFSLSETNAASTAMPSTKAYTISEEIGQHLKLPLMAAVAHRISNIPATSVPSESTFSVAGYIARKQRSCLSSDAIRYSLVLKDRNRLKRLQK